MASFKSEFIPEQFFTLPSEELALKALQIIFLNLLMKMMNIYIYIFPIILFSYKYNNFNLSINF